MDPLSCIASIIAILGALSSTVEAAKRVWGAPNELQDLASELSQLRALANTLTALTRARSFRDIDLRILEQAYTILHDGQKVSEEWLSKRHKTSIPESRFRRTSWILHRGRIRKLKR